jgi:hypothetical protein
MKKIFVCGIKRSILARDYNTDKHLPKKSRFRIENIFICGIKRSILARDDKKDANFTLKRTVLIMKIYLFIF